MKSTRTEIADGSTSDNQFRREDAMIDPAHLRRALGTFATGVTVVTAMAADGRPYGVTCNSFASVSLSPPLILWSLRTVSRGLDIFRGASYFAVNVLGASQAALATQFAKPSVDKFYNVAWTPGLGEAPLITDCVASLQCSAAGLHHGGDHVIFIGAVEAYSYSHQEPLLFAFGRFGRFLPDDANPDVAGDS